MASIAPAAVPAAAKKVKAAKKSRYVIDVSQAEKGKVLKASDFEAFLATTIKVDGKAGQLAGKVDVKRDGAKITVESSLPYAKRYFKYLTKKYLKKHELRDYLRVIANSKVGYELRFFKLGGDADEE